MNKTEKQIAQAASKFTKRREGRGYEEGESQLLWTELLKAHRDNDRAFIAAYGFHATLPKPEIVARLINPLQQPHPATITFLKQQNSLIFLKVNRA